MAGEPSLFYIYKDIGTEHNSDSWYGTQALADAAAVDGGADFSANQGAVDVPTGWVTGWIRNPGDGKWRLPAVTDLSDTEQVQSAAHVMLDVFDDALGFIMDHRTVWSVTNVEKATEGIYWQIVNMARVALNATRTAANRVKALGEAASWPTGVNGDVRQYVDAMEDGIALPTKDWSWVDPETDPPGRTGVANMEAGTGFENATNVEDAPSSAKLIGRDWINDIP